MPQILLTWTWTSTSACSTSTTASEGTITSTIRSKSLKWSPHQQSDKKQVVKTQFEMFCKLCVFHSAFLSLRCNILQSSGGLLYWCTPEGGAVHLVHPSSVPKKHCPWIFYFGILHMRSGRPLCFFSPLHSNSKKVINVIFQAAWNGYLPMIFLVILGHTVL